MFKNQKDWNKLLTQQYGLSIQSPHIYWIYGFENSFRQIFTMLGLWQDKYY